MATNQTRQHVSSFSGGMNSDLSIATMKHETYRYAENVRIGSLFENNGSLYSNKIGDIFPLNGTGAVETDGTGYNITGILACGTIREYGYVIARVGDNKWVLFRSKGNGKLQFVFGATTEYNEPLPDKFSVVSRYEDEDNIKLYIADGINPIMILNISPSQDEYNHDLYGDINKIRSYSEIEYTPPIFVGLTSGSLKPALVQYSYLLYNKNGISSDISPATKLIPIIKNAGQNDAKQVTGVKQGENSNCGVILKFNVGDVLDYLNYVRIYRITYQENGQLPTVELISDKKVRNKEFLFVDAGQETISTLTLEEYNSLSGIHIIPKIIESKNDYLFAANIKDIQYDESDVQKDVILNWDSRAYRYDVHGRTHLFDYDTQEMLVAVDFRIPKDHDCFSVVNDMSKDLKTIDQARAASIDNDGSYDMFKKDTRTVGGEGPNISWKFIFKELIGDHTDEGRIILDEDFENTYANPKRVYDSKSLRRGELYRYGIVLYDKYGQAYPVKWIADIRVPEVYDSEFELYRVGEGDDSNTVYVRSIGIQFDVKNIPDQIVAYEIVRCNRTERDVKSLSQGAISRSLQREYREDFLRFETFSSTRPYTPSGLLTTLDYGTSGKFIGERLVNVGNYKMWHTYELSNIDNYSIFQFASPEICYQQDSFSSMIKKDQLKLSSLSYIRPSNEEVQNVDYSNKLPFWVYVDDYKSGLYDIYMHKIGRNIKIPTTTRPSIDPLGGHYNPSSFYSGVISPEMYAYCFYDEVDDERGYYVIVDSTGHRVASEWENWSSVKPKHYSYIKLYDKSKNVCVQTEQDEFGMTIENRPSNYTFDIENAVIANTMNWDDAVEQKDQNATCKYKNYILTIGSRQYCNWVSGTAQTLQPLTNDEFGNKLLYSSDKDAIDDLRNTKRAAITTFGPGGKCAVLQLKASDNDMLYRTKTTPDLVTGDRCTVENMTFGTFLCNLTHNVIPYYGYGKSSRDICLYTSYGDFTKVLNNKATIDVFDGDCYVCPFEYVSMHKTYWPTDSSTLTSFSIINSFFVETNINLFYTQGYEFSKNYKDTLSTNLQIEPSAVYNTLVQKDPLYVYNGAYSASGKTKIFAAEDSSNVEYNKRIDFRCMNSLLKLNDEKIDNWLKFQPANYIDVDSNYGEITNLKTFNNTLYFWLKTAVGMLSVNDQQLVQSVNNTNLILGTGGVLDRYDYVSKVFGMKPNQYCAVSSEDRVYWYDLSNNMIHTVTNEVNSVSMNKGVQNIMNGHRDVSKVPTMMYDRKFKEVVANVLDGHSIVFNEGFQVFTSTYTIPFDGYMLFDDNLYLVRTNNHDVQTTRWNVEGSDTSWGTPLNVRIDYVVNNEHPVVKVFDNQEIVSQNDPYNPTERPQFDKLTYTFDSDVNHTESDGIEMTDREGSFRYAIPRQYIDGAPALYGNRIRGKYMTCSISGRAEYFKAPISNIITKYRTSWI